MQTAEQRVAAQEADWENVREGRMAGYYPAEMEQHVATPEAAIQFVQELHEDYGVAPEEKASFEKALLPAMAVLSETEKAQTPEGLEANMMARVGVYDVVGRHAARMAGDQIEGPSKDEMTGFSVACALESREIDFEVRTGGAMMRAPETKTVESKASADIRGPVDKGTVNAVFEDDARRGRALAAAKAAAQRSGAGKPPARRPVKDADER